MVGMRVETAPLRRVSVDVATERKRVEAAVTFAQRATTGSLKERLRAQVATTTLGQRVAKTWQGKTYRDGGVDGAAYVFSKAPAIIAGFDRAGGLIRSRSGRHMAIPTGFNQVAGHRGRGGRGKTLVTPQQMAAADPGRTFTLPIAGGLLWCVRVSRVQQKSQKTGRLRDLAVAGDFMTRARGGQLSQLVLGSGRRQRTQAILERGYVPMFLLLREVRRPRVLDVRAVADGGPQTLIDAIGAKLSGD